MKTPRLAPITTSRTFLETYTTLCKQAGLPQELIEENYHRLRLEEARLQSPDFASGFDNVVEKAHG
jgi:hypothetical protein